MTYGTFCSGIGAPECAWSQLGWRSLFASEIEPFPCAVLAHHYPHTPNLGDMERISAETLNRFSPDVVCAGTPCQSFSVAGLRKGMADPRGNLALVLLGLVDRLRPRWLVWENVPGVLSSGDRRDFGSFLGALGQLGYGWAYRILDAQFCGVPQRRRRVFVVGCLGDWRGAAAVLFERHGLQGHPAPSREAGQGVAGTIKACSGGSGTPNGAEEADRLIALSFDEYNALVGDTAHTMAGGGRSNRIGSAVVPILEASKRCGLRADARYGLGIGQPGDPMFTMQAVSQHAVAFQTRIALNGRGQPEEVCPSLQGAGAGATSDMRPCVASSMAVRRLTPLECERLQGFPDGYTDIPFKGKPAADGPRYRALGNSMAVPVLRWIGERIQAVDAVLSARERGVA